MNSTILGVIIGGVVGTAAAMAFAPQSGRDTRRDLLNKGKKMIGQGPEVDPVFPGEDDLETVDTLNKDTRTTEDLERI